jgi:hypothetical protein
MRAHAAAAVVLIAVLLAPLAGAQAASDPIREAGKSIYYSATRLDGSAVRATVQQDVPLPPGAGACVSCHRRSGLGVAEGGARALNISGPSLFRASDVAPIRPAYDDALLARAVIAGIDANGEALSDLMPRYDLSADDAVAIARYLRDLGAESAPGVSDSELMIATIITPDAPPDERLALETIIPEYVEVKNGGTRQERRRAEASSLNSYGIKRYRAHREWRHSFWQLTGSPDSWTAQLRQYYLQSPPFAILSGSIGTHATIVHDFCEQFQIACILPMTDLPPASETGFYTLYFSSGTRLEAQVIASYLSDDLGTDGGKTLMIFADDEAGVAAADELRNWLAKKSATALTVRQLQPGKVLSVSEWTRLLRESSARTLVLFASAGQLRNLASPKLDPGLLPDRILTTQSLTDWSQAANAQALLGRVLHVYPYSLPVSSRSQFPREDVWLNSRGIQGSNAVDSAKVLFACKAFGMAIADIQSNFSREYLIESMEHALDNSFLTSLYPRTTLGPDQRYLSRGAYLAKIELAGDNVRAVSGTWIQP